MVEWLWSAAAVLAAYLLGSVSFAVVISRVMGLSDPRTFGSKNPGATNVLRSGSKAAAAVTLGLDVLKGWLPVFVVQQLGAPHGMGAGTQALAGLAAFLGHLWPLFFRFKGGKGVATAAGVAFAFSPWLGLAVVTAWALVLALSRYVSLASLAAALFAPACYMLAGDVLWTALPPVAAVLAAMGFLLIYRHGENISRLIKGTESRLGGQKKDAPPPARKTGRH
ncbi:MAG: glycerol-3-phosphate 1-O-acyltransferase PlsY [Burkholderiaceae bacterium]|nr:glycerol-3-phosphate 1-O-acyltransferase PlsY [Burkholderiaceae bacterium]